MPLQACARLVEEPSADPADDARQLRRLGLIHAEECSTDAFERTLRRTGSRSRPCMSSLYYTSTTVAGSTHTTLRTTVGHSTIEAENLMPLAHRRICGLCGRAFAIVLPPDEPERERDKLCHDCARQRGLRTLLRGAID